MTTAEMCTGLLFIALMPAIAAAERQAYKPETISRQSPSEIYVNLGPSLSCEAAAVQIGPLLNPLGENIPLETQKICEGNEFFELLLTLPEGTEMAEKIDYALFIRLAADDQYKLENHLAIVGQRKGRLDTIIRSEPRNVAAFFPSPVQPDSVTAKIKSPLATAPRDVSIIRTPQLGANGTNVSFVLGERVRHNDVLIVSATSVDGALMPAKAKVNFGKPKTRDQSSLWASLSWLASGGVKPTTKLDFKFDQRARFDQVVSWQRAWSIDAELATQDRDRTRKGTFSYFFTKRQLLSSNAGGNDYSIGPSLEADDDLDNRNLLARFEFVPVRNAFYALADGSAYVQPTFGLEVGRNFGLKSELDALEDYDIARAVVGFTVATKWPIRKAWAKELTASLDYTGRFLFSSETDTRDVPEALQEMLGETMVVADDGYKDYLTATLNLSLSEYFSFALKYENGEKPMLFQDIDRFSAELVYSY